MAPVSTSTVANESASTTATDRRAPARRAAPVRPAPAATDDEILGLDSNASSSADADRAGLRVAPTSDEALDDLVETSTTAEPAAPVSAGISEPIRAALEANPDLRRAWDEAQAYREAFATPEAARAATAQLADLDRLDALFYSRRPEDHAELARAVASLDAESFSSLAKAMNEFAGASPIAARTAEHLQQAPQSTSAQAQSPANEPRQQDVGATPTQAQSDFFHATNAAAVQSVLDAIQIQVERLLPENISKSARNRVVGEIYRELDTTLGSNRQLAQQMRDALRSGGLDAEHQRAVVTLITGRARQALPGVAKRVLNEWTSTVVAAHNDRRARQQAAERRVDIGGSSGAGSDGPRSMTPREVDYRRMSDADILNL